MCCFSDLSHTHFRGSRVIKGKTGKKLNENAKCLEKLSTRYLKKRKKNSQFEIAFSASTRCLCVCLFCLQVDMLSCFNVQIYILVLVIQIQNKTQNTIFWALAVCDTYSEDFQKWLNHTTINHYHWFTDPKFCMQCLGIFKKWPTKVDLSIPECTRWYSQWHVVDA